MIPLYTDEKHKVVVFRGFTPRGYVQANQLVIADSGEGLLADPSGRVVFPKLVSEISLVVPAPKIKYVFFSHQDPDIVGAAASWYTALPNAKIVLPEVWARFIPHLFPAETNPSERFYSVPDSGAELALGACTLKLVPAHFLHSPGNFQIYDPCSRVLFSGDLFASLTPESQDYDFVADFEAHVQYMEPFHRRYMAGNKAIQAWLNRVRGLDVEAIVPQHGAIIRGRENVQKALRWLEQLKCGIDLL
ncbi:MBL fold metallo-hydrolase [Infirmifilum lucidum]|uniref:MBL fold metallo-hydrolase n=1 Tax=Infirmifilum lucidum TaxID=2776706 RepID=A0A7L9FKT3_9CREN|nr:MBL fold metallo-hydrolase [Infirmifilum lucidum]QOJ79415.1 MBL fold metallo-hydrolase [Infirmifilum lucidum]